MNSNSLLKKNLRGCEKILSLSRKDAKRYWQITLFYLFRSPLYLLANKRTIQDV
jgi:hypothetical protein